LVAITPASGWVGPMASIIIGVAAGTLCYGAVAFKNSRKWDDALDVWGVHGIGGFTGAVLTGTLASPHIWDTGDGIGAWTGTPEGMEQQAINIAAMYVSCLYVLCDNCYPEDYGRYLARWNSSYSKRGGSRTRHCPER